MVEPKAYKWFIEYTSPEEGHIHGIRTIQYSSQTKLQKMEIMDSGSYGRCLVLDGKMQSSITDEFIYHEGLVLVRRRHAELSRAIAERRWFDPWVFDLEGPELTPQQAVQPWVAGFAAALERFPALLACNDPTLIEPLAVIYASFDAEDLEDADDLLATIETLEPAADMAEAVEELVRSVLRIADVTRPRVSRPHTARPASPRARRPARRPA